MKRLIVFFCALLVSALAVQAQTPGNVNTFSFNVAPVSLPGGGQTVAGVDSGASFTVTQNFDLKERNLLGSNFQYFAGGFNYRLPVLSTKLNNASPNLNGLRFQFYLTGSVGVDRLTAGATKQHYAFTGGGGINYDITSSGTWTLGGEVEYAKFPGYANNTWIVRVGPAWHF